MVLFCANMAAACARDAEGDMLGENGELSMCMEEDDFDDSGTDSEDDEEGDSDTGIVQPLPGASPELPPHGPVTGHPPDLLQGAADLGSDHEGPGEAGEDTGSGAEDAGEGEDDDADAVTPPPPPFRPTEINGHLIAYVALDLETTSSQRPPLGDICSIGVTSVCWGVGAPTTQAAEGDEGLNVIIDPGLPEHAWGAINTATHGMTAVSNRGKTEPKAALIQLNGYLEKAASHAEKMYREANPDSPPLHCEICIITHNGKGASLPC